MDERAVEIANEEAEEHAEHERLKQAVVDDDIDLPDLWDRYERVAGDVRYAKRILREHDVYGSGRLDGMVREAATVLRERAQRIDELLARCTELENERRMWKARHGAVYMLLEGFSSMLASGLVGAEEGGADAAKAEERVAIGKILAVADRNRKLEGDAWSKCAQLARDFVEAAARPMMDYAPDVVLPGDGKDPKSRFVDYWAKRFRAALG